MSNVININEWQKRRKRALKAKDVYAARERFGSWGNWSEAEIMYLLDELAQGHWDDCGDTMHGFAIATRGIKIAISANKGPLTNDTVEEIISDIWGIADYIILTDFGDIERPELKRTIEDIIQVTK